MDYYQPPADHRNAAEMERLQEQVNALTKERTALEQIERDFNDQMEIRYSDIEFRLESLERQIEALYWETNRG
jgi:chaperonin cofactor prefoldin